MAIICRPWNLLFLMVPRTACTAVANVLISDLGGEYLPSEHILKSDGMIRINKKHCTLRELLWAGLLRPADVSALVKLTTVRNPFDSLVSLYVKKRYKYQTLLEDANAWVHRVAGYVADMQYCREHTFEEWIFVNYNKGPLSRIYWLKRRSFSEKYTAGVDYVMRYEYLQEDFNKALSLAGI